MQDDLDNLLILQENNPFWDLYYSDFEVLEITEPPEIQLAAPPDQHFSIGSIILFSIALSVGILWLFLNKKAELLRSKSFPNIFYNDKHQWLFYKITDNEVSIVTGNEEWIPYGYSLDVNGGFFIQANPTDGNYNEVNIKELQKAAIKKSSTYALPITFIIFSVLVIYFYTNLRYQEEYNGYLVEIEAARYQQSLFDPFAGMCELNNKESLIPQQMTVNVIYDLPEGSNPPISVEEYYYLEDDTLFVDGEEFQLPVQSFIFNSPELIVGNSGENINFYRRSNNSENCTEGNTFFQETLPESEESVAYLVPIDDLKILSLGGQSGLYESRLQGFYENEYLINASSYQVRIVQQRFSIDNLPDCDSLDEGGTYQPRFTGNGDILQGQLVPWGTVPSSTIDIPDFQGCSNLQVIQYQQPQQ